MGPRCFVVRWSWAVGTWTVEDFAEHAQPGGTFVTAFFRPTNVEAENVTTYKPFQSYVDIQVRGHAEWVNKGVGSCPVHVVNPSYHCLTAQTLPSTGLARNCTLCSLFD